MMADTSSRRLEELLTEHRGSIFALCYRLVGSVEDAEDLTQETLMRAAESYESFERRSSFRTWIYRIATNLCYNFLKSAKKRHEVVLPDPLATTEEFLASVALDTDIDDVRESLEFSFVCVLQELSPLQRLVVVLRDVLGWSVGETASAVGTDAAAVKNVHSRARKHLKFRRSAGRTLPPSHPEAVHLMERFAESQMKGDVATTLDLYREDAEVYLFPMRKFVGKTEIRELHESMSAMPPRLFVGVRLNGNLGAACYHPTPDGNLARTGVVILEAVKEVWRSTAKIGRTFWAMEPQYMTTIPTPTEMELPTNPLASFLL